MATVYKRKGFPNYYVAFIDAAGKRHYRSTKSTRKAEAMQIAFEWERASRRVGDSSEDTKRVLAILEEATDRALRGNLNTAVARDLLNQIVECSTGARVFDPSVEEWFKSWLLGKKGVRSVTTSLRYNGIVEAFLEFLPAQKRLSPLGSLTIDDIRRFRDHVVNDGRSQATANLVLKTIRSPLTSARKQGLITHNPAEAVELLALRSKEKGVFTPEQVGKLIEAAKGGWRGLILAGYYTGARVGDLCDLDWEAVDMKEEVVRFTQGKTGRRVEIPIHPELMRYFKEAPEETRSGPVFPAHFGKTSGGRNGLSGQFNRIMAKAKISGTTTDRTGEGGRSHSSLTFHSLRHSFNSAMANAGVTQEIRQKLTGHASKAINDRYTHAEIETLRKAVDSVPGLSS